MEDIKNERIYTVYKHILPMSVSRKDNDMVYIGITSIQPEVRWARMEDVIIILHIFGTPSKNMDGIISDIRFFLRV